MVGGGEVMIAGGVSGRAVVCGWKKRKWRRKEQEVVSFASGRKGHNSKLLNRRVVRASIVWCSIVLAGGHMQVGGGGDDWSARSTKNARRRRMNEVLSSLRACECCEY